MGKRRGRPVKEDEPENRQVRVFTDLADMIGWIHFFRKQTNPGLTIAQILDPILRAKVVEMYAPYEKLVKEIEAKGEVAESPPGKKNRRGE